MTITAPEVTATDDVARLREDLAQARRDLAQARDNHRSDIATIGAVLLEKAQNYDWCEVFDRAVSDINSRLHVPLPVRERTYAVTVRGYLRVPYTHTVYVTVAGEDDIEDAANEGMDCVGVDDVNVVLSDAEFDDDLDVIDTEQV